MKKTIRLVSILLVVAMMVTLCAGCSLFTKDNGKYRAQAAITVGNQDITIGQILDAYNNAYYQYYYYIAYGYMDVSELFDMVMESLYTRAMKIDSYTADSANVVATQSNSYYASITNSKYLTESEMEKAVKTTIYSLFSAFDSYVESYIEIDFTLGELDDEEDTSRDFTEYDDLEGATTYAEYSYNTSLEDEDSEEYFTDYYPTLTFDKADYSSYVYATEAEAQKRLDNINERIKEGAKDDDGELPEDYTEEAYSITFDELKAWQEKAIAEYTKTVKNSYGKEFGKFVDEQVAQVVGSFITYKYDYKVASQIEGSDLATTLSEIYGKEVDSYKTKYNVDSSSFVTDIEDLSSTSYVYNVPEQYEDSYIFVKNILIPFTTEQSNYLTALGNRLGSTTSEEYINARTALAAEIVATDYNGAKDDEGEYTDKIEGLFVKNGDKIELASGTALSEVFGADGKLVSGKSVDDVVALMKRFNTDTAQHTATYDYVVRVGETPASYTASWVSEFVDAAKEAYNNGTNGYGICVSTYGVHIVYYVKNVATETMDFAGKLASGNYDTASSEYRFFKSYYEDQLSKVQTLDLDTLEETYKSKISATEVFDEFIEENSIEYDFAEAIKFAD